LADWEGDETGGILQPRLQKQELLDEALRQPIPANILHPQLPGSQPAKGADPALWIRMLFSCLVDADFLDTEAFMDADQSGHRATYPSLGELAVRFETHTQQLTTSA
jgi:CRISPR-associated endonuclease/helicase Cas3